MNDAGERILKATLEWDVGLAAKVTITVGGKVAHVGSVQDADWPAMLERLLVWEAVATGDRNGIPFHLLLPGPGGPGLVLTRTGAVVLSECGTHVALHSLAPTMASLMAMGTAAHERAHALGVDGDARHAPWRQRGGAPTKPDATRVRARAARTPMRRSRSVATTGRRA